MNNILKHCEANNEVLLTTYVAGWSWHDGDSILNLLKPGKRLRLIREAGNKHDHNAVAVYFSNTKIGYIPKKDNSDIAKLMDVGEGSSLVAFISEVVQDDQQQPSVRFIIHKI